MASEHVNAYPEAEQYDRWVLEAESRGYECVGSPFIRDMVEAGLKKFNAAVEPDETNRELRTQRNDLRRELRRARGRIEELEDRLHGGEHEAIREYVADNPGATFDDIIMHVNKGVPDRVIRHIEEMEGSDLTRQNGDFYPVDEGEPDGG